jgi:hypothetical protein
MEWLYDSFVRRLFFEEIITTVTATRSIYDCGILEAFSNSIKANHAKSVLESNTLVMLFAHSKRFIDSYFDEFARRVRSGKKTIIYCNHPKSAAAIYYSSCGRNQNYIESSIAELISMIGKLDVSGQMIKVEYINVVPRYALVMFDDIAYVIMATSSEGQAAVPALVVRRGSPMWRFLEDDLDRIRTNHCYTGPHQ